MAFDYCVEIFEVTAGKQHLVFLQGLRKNQTLPAKGKGTYQTQKQIRPGKSEDRIKIPIYSGDKHTRAIYNDYRGEVVITGADLPGMLPEGSEVELTVEVNESRMITVSASFPYLDDEILDGVIKTGKRKTRSKEYLEKELKNAIQSLEDLEEEYPELDLVEKAGILSGLNELESLLEKGGAEDDTRNLVLNRLQGYLKDIDALESKGEWPKALQGIDRST